MEANKVMRMFFRCFGIALIISACRVDVRGLPNLEAVKLIYTTIGFVIIIGIFTGISSVISETVIFFLKKN